MFSLSRNLFLCAMITASAGLRANVINISSVAEYTQHYQGTKPMIAMFTASWCGPCKQTKPHYIEFANTYTDISFCIIDIDNKDLASLHSEIKGVPTFVFSHKGQVVTKKSGGMTRTQLQEMIDTFKAEATGQKRAPAKKAPALSSDEYYKKGQDQYRKVVAICEKKDFDSAALDAVMYDETIMQLAQTLGAEDATSELHKKAFEDFKTYSRGSKSILEGYKSPHKNPQDAIIRYNLKSIEMALSSPDYATYVSYQVKLGAILQKKMKEMTWEVLADIDFSVLS